MASLINALAARYPVVRKLLWDDTFVRVARQYVTAEPPRSPVLFAYGESFPRYLRAIGQGPAADYVADIAELEAARTRAYHAADAVPVGADAFANLPADRLADTRLILHPSVTLLSSRFPIVRGWQANLSANDNTLTEWRPESVLIARPELEVEVHLLTPGGFAFLTALSEGQTIGLAIASAVSDAPDFDLNGSFATLIAANIVVGIDTPADRRTG